MEMLYSDLPLKYESKCTFFLKKKFPLDLTQKPEIHIPESGVGREPATLICTIEDTCQGLWKGPAMSSNTIVSIRSSSELSSAPKPEDRGTTLRCRLSLSLVNLTSSKEVKLKLVCEYWWALPGSTGGEVVGPRARPGSWRGAVGPLWG